jgi:IgA Peptidase M64
MAKKGLTRGLVLFLDARGKTFPKFRGCSEKTVPAWKASRGQIAAMAIVAVQFLGSDGRDIHVLAGQASLTLNDRLWIQDSSSSNWINAPTYIGSHPTVSLSFNALFKGAPNAIGLHVDPTDGHVTADAALPPLRKHNFIIEVTATDSSDHSSGVDRIRVHVHQSVKSVALTPSDLTVRPSAATRTSPEATGFRFAVRATFDDDTMGDLTTGHGVAWTSSAPAIDGSGRYSIDPSANVGDVITVTATLPAGLGGGSATGRLHIAQPWSAEPTMPQAGLVPGGGWPGATQPEQAPNVLLMGDGFAAADVSNFYSIASQMVHFIKTDKVVRPFDLLVTSMNFWSVVVPSAQRGISIRCEAYAVDAQTVSFVSIAEPPAATGAWSLKNLVYAVGLPMPTDVGRAVGDIRSDWAALVSQPPTAAQVSDFLVQRWQAMGKRGFVDEIDGFPAMSLGEPPAANANSSIPELDLHPDRVGRQGMNSFFNALASNNGVAIGTNKLGVVWSASPGTYVFDNSDLVVLITAHPAGRGVNATGYIAVCTESNNVWVAAKQAAGGSNFTLNFTAAPSEVSEDTSRTVTHELGHSFGLGDEYVDFETAYTDPKTAVADSANLQRLADVQSGTPPQIDGSLIRWNWHRIRNAAVLTAAPANGPSAGSFQVQVRPGEGLQFAAQDLVLLRLRKPGTVIDYASNVVELQTMQVVSRTTDTVIVTAATGSTVTLTDVQKFTPGSILFKPVPLPKSAPAGTDAYARMVAKNVENLITGAHAPLYLRPARANLTDDEKTNSEIQHPKLDGLTPGRPGRPFCFKVKPSIVGLYGGGRQYASDVFHPAGAICMMRNDHLDGSPFCSVCRYIMVDMIDPFQHFRIDLDYDDIYPLR